MVETAIPYAEPAAFEELAHRLDRDIKEAGFFSSRFQGKSTEHIIVECADPEKEAGQVVPLNLRKGPCGRPVYGDDLVIDAEDRQAVHADIVILGLFPQEPGFPRAKVVRPSLSDLRKCLKAKYIAQFAEAVDAMIFKFLAGVPGSRQSDLIHPGVMFDQQYNALLRPDLEHFVFSGDAKWIWLLTGEDKMNMRLLDMAILRANSMTERYPDGPKMRPIRVGNSEYYVAIMHPLQLRDLKKDIGEPYWSEIKRNLANSEVNGQPIARDAVGIIGNLILYSHPSIMTYMGGENADMPCASALLLGCQAGMIAYGGFAKGECVADSQANAGIEEKSTFILQRLIGFNKCRYGKEYKESDCGVIRMDTAINPKFMGFSFFDSLASLRMPLRGKWKRG